MSINPISFNIVYEKGAKQEEPPRLQYTMTIDKTVDKKTSDEFRKKLKDFDEVLRNKTLEVLNSDEGLTVVVLKHNKDDGEYVKGTGVGVNASEAYKKVNEAWRNFFGSEIQLSKNAIDNMQRLITEEHNFIDVGPGFPSIPALRGTHVTLMRMLIEGLKGSDLIKKITDHQDELKKAIKEAKDIIDELKAKEKDLIDDHDIASKEVELDLKEMEEAELDLKEMKALQDLYQKGLKTEVGEGKDNLIDDISATKAHIEELLTQKTELEQDTVPSLTAILSIYREDGSEEQAADAQEEITAAENRLQSLEKQINELKKGLDNLETQSNKPGDSKIVPEPTDNIGEGKDIDINTSSDDDIPTIKARIEMLVSDKAEIEESILSNNAILLVQRENDEDTAQVEKNLAKDEKDLKEINEQIFDQQKFLHILKTNLQIEKMRKVIKQKQTLIEDLQSKHMNPKSSQSERQNLHIEIFKQQRSLTELQDALKDLYETLTMIDNKHRLKK